MDELPLFAQDLLRDHDHCLNELKLLSTKTADQKNLPVTWH